MHSIIISSSTITFPINEKIFSIDLHFPAETLCILGVSIERVGHLFDR